MPDEILMAHGDGGKLARNLVAEAFVEALANPILERLDDSAIVELNGRTAFTTDSYVVTPIFFPGGDIGRLAVCGTVNDLATSGARPLYLSLSLIIEEGLPREDLDRVIASVREAADEAGVVVVTGDTKVVDRGSADKLYINTAGIGAIPEGVDITGDAARPGDVVLLSGSLGDHGIAVMSQREGIAFSTRLTSDCAPLNRMVSEMLDASPRIHCLRDPTRGGLATTLNEIARQSRARILIEETSIPVKEEVAAACEMLGLDPLYMANEGKLVAVVPASDVGDVLQAMRRSRYGEEAVIVGEVVPGEPGRVAMRTRLGTTRIVDMLSGGALPRIC
jgi:hydrogenase expression/formation protein HypE